MLSVDVAGYKTRLGIRRSPSQPVVTISFATHGHFEAVLPQDFLIVMRTILRPAICVMDAAFRRRSKRDSHVQRPDRKIAFHSIANCPTDNAPGVQIEDHGKIQPAFARPYVADIACPFLIRLFSREVPIQQVRRDVELVIAIRRDFVFAGPYDRYAVLTHQPAYTAVPDIQADLLQLFRHPWPTIAAKAKTRLFHDVSQRHQIRSLPATSRTAAEGTQPPCADVNDMTQPIGREAAPVFFDKPKSHCFRPAKNWVAFFNTSLLFYP